MQTFSLPATSDTATEPAPAEAMAPANAPASAVEPAPAEGMAPTDDRTRRLATITADLIGTMRLIRCEASGRLTKRGVSMTHMHLLWLLDEHHELAMNRVAEVLGVSPANATGLVDRMEERGLVERLRVPDDRRIVLVRLAAGGREAIDEMETMRMDLAEAVLRRFDAEQLARLEGALHDFQDAVRAETGALPASSSRCSEQPAQTVMTARTLPKEEQPRR